MKPQKAKCFPQAVIPQKGRYNSGAGCVCGTRTRKLPMKEPGQGECNCSQQKLILPHLSILDEGVTAGGSKVEKTETNKELNCRDERHLHNLENLTKQNERGKSYFSYPSNDRAFAPRDPPCPLSFCPPAAATSLICSCGQKVERQQQGFCPHSRKMGTEHQKKMPNDVLQDYQKKQDFLCFCPKNRIIQDICDDMRKKMKSHREICNAGAEMMNGAYYKTAKNPQPQEPQLSDKPCTSDDKQNVPCICPAERNDAYVEPPRNLRPYTKKNYEGEIKCPGRQPMMCPRNEAILLQDTRMKEFIQIYKTGNRICICTTADNADVKKDICSEEDNHDCYSQGRKKNAGKESCNVMQQNDICNKNDIVNEDYDASSEEEPLHCEDKSFGYFSSMENIPGGSQSRILEDYDECGEFVSYRDRSTSLTGKSPVCDRDPSAAVYQRKPRTPCPQIEPAQHLQTGEQQCAENQRFSLPIRRKIFVDPAQFPSKSFLKQYRVRCPITSTPVHPHGNLPSFNVSSIPQRSPHQQQDECLHESVTEFEIGGEKFARPETRVKKTTDEQHNQRDQESPIASGLKTLVDDEACLEPTSQQSKIENQIQDNCMKEQQQSPGKWSEPRGRPAGTQSTRNILNLEDCPDK